MRAKMLLSAFSLLLACALLPSPCSAQTLSIGSAEVRRGTTVDIPVQFVPGVRDVVGFQLAVVYDPAILGAPTCLASNASVCSVGHDVGRIALIYVHPHLLPMAEQTLAILRFPVRRDVRHGTHAALGALGAMFVGPDTQAVPFTIYTGRIDVR